MNRRPHRRHAGDRGASLVEMALVTIILLFVLVGVVDIGRLFNSYVVITNAAREGARYASRFPHLASGIRAAAKQEAANSGIVLADGDIFINPEPPGGALPGDPGVAQPGEMISVSVQYDFPTTIASMIGLGTIPVRTQTQMIVFGLDV